MKSFVIPALFVIIFALGLLYILPLNTPFPGPPPNSVQSMEEADTETSLRRAYFTNYTREQVIAHYAAQMERFPSLQLNYPPEEAKTLIRDQTRSWYLEELNHPLRQSVYINGFIAQNPQDDIWYKGVHYEQKITIRLIQSTRVARIIVWLCIVVSTYLLCKMTFILAKKFTSLYGTR